MSHADKTLELAAFRMDVEGVSDDEQQITYNTIRRCCPELRRCLMGNPAAIDIAVAALLKKKQRHTEELSEVVNKQSVLFLESLLESSSDEESHSASG